MRGVLKNLELRWGMQNKIELASRTAAPRELGLQLRNVLLVQTSLGGTLVARSTSLRLEAHRENKRKLGKKRPERREKEAAASWVVAATAAAASFVLLLRDETDERGLTDGRMD